MIETESGTYARLSAISATLNEIRRAEPNPLHSREDEVVSFVEQLQAVGSDIQALLHERGAGLAPTESAALERKLGTIDAVVRRQVLLVGRRVAGGERETSLDILHAIFKLGRPIEKPLDGKYRGDFVAACLFRPLDVTGRAFSRLWFPWLGKRFDAGSQTGLNMFTPGVRFAGRLFWPTFSDYRPGEDGMLLAFDFTTYSAPGVQDPKIETLKLDYDLPTNPRFLVRTVLDEITQITSNYYLGKAFLRGSDGGYKLAAFFAVRKWEE